MIEYIWIPITLVAAALQTLRNATQRQLTEIIGMAGATQVRFVYGLPFAILLLFSVSYFSGDEIPTGTPLFFIFIIGGAIAQILATLLMLMAMRGQGFTVVVTYTKTEPVHIALYSLFILGESLSIPMLAGVTLAVVGVVLASLRPTRSGGVIRASFAGIVAGSFFAVSATCFRAAIQELDSGGFLSRASTALVWSLFVQSTILLVWMLLFDRKALSGSLHVWRSSLTAGGLGALASEFWFAGFALTSAVNVRTLALIEVLFAQALSRRLFTYHATWTELVGIVLMIAGVSLVLLAPSL